MPFQIFGMAIVGFAGGIYKRYVGGAHSAQVCAEVAVLGAFLTLLYDVITNFGVAVSWVLTGTPWHIALISALSMGAPFSLVHIVSNVVLFGSGLIPLIKALKRVPGGEALWSEKELLYSQR